jgi:glycosyltransferase involved in cell wall biosynthesis
MFVVNVDWFFLSHRLPIALQAMAEGYEVHVACGDTGRCAEIEVRGLIVHRLNLARGKASLFSSLSSFLEILFLFRCVRPDIVHLVTIKPVIFGGVAARLAGVRSVVAAISGLGFVFVGKGVATLLLRMFVGPVYRLALGKRNLKVIFQNPDDRDTLRSLAALPESKIVMIRGSGVDLDEYQVLPIPEGVPVVMLAARLLRDKGVMEFVEAAALLQARGCRARFCLVGNIDPDNPASLTPEDMVGLREQGRVELWGHRSDMHAVLPQASIVALPSYYGEGLPKVLIEAAACGRAVVTTNHPGCRDSIDPGVCGVLVPARDPMALADAIGMLLDDPERLAAMGMAGRKLAEKEFDVAQVVRQHMAIYRELEAAAA